jgi:hypothetical protein
MKKETLTNFFLHMLNVLICYLSTSFIQWEFDPGVWTQTIRGCVIMIFFSVSFLIFIFRQMKEI